MTTTMATRIPPMAPWANNDGMLPLLQQGRCRVRAGTAFHSPGLILFRRPPRAKSGSPPGVVGVLKHGRS
jgi:hypothetical protein